MTTDWNPASWRDFPIRQVPSYPDETALRRVETELAHRPPLVFAGEIQTLREQIAAAARGEAFILQGGDCAESFAEFSADLIKNNFNLVLQMAVILMFSASRPIVKIGRMAGQFAKPRSAPNEVQNGQSLPSYRGDIINHIQFEPQARQPDPARMITAYHQSACTLNLLRAFATGGYANLEQVHTWTTDFLTRHQLRDDYYRIADQITQALAFFAACGIESRSTRRLRETAFYTSHEALLLWYEEALTRRDSLTGHWVDCSAHMVWVGERTRSMPSAHLEFVRGIENPVGLKCGPATDPRELVKILQFIEPENRPGRVVLIARMGAGHVKAHLPALVREVKKSGRHVAWSCDPMHGNTIKASNGYKTRRLLDIFREVEQFFEILRNEDVPPGGIHLEMTSQNVTECLGGPRDLAEKDLSSRYHTHCDPRLNADQSLELAFLIAHALEPHLSAGGLAGNLTGGKRTLKETDASPQANPQAPQTEKRASQA